MRETRLKKEYLPFALGTLIWVITVLWINFHGAQWYNFDMYADADVARRMAEQNTLFPRDWIFGNQYYVIATPVVASLFYHACHNSVLAMSFASSLMFCLILLCCVWSFRPIFSAQALWVGLFCMAGGTLLGDSISSSTYGFQILYTMASYYACYLLVIVLHIGIWVRLRKNRRLSPVFPVLALMGSFALGVQSPRETLSLCIPLLLVTLILWLRYRKDPGEKKSLVFAAASLTGNLLGLYLHRVAGEHWGIQTATNVNTLGSGVTSGSILERISESGRAFLDLVGLRYLHYGWKWKPLAVLGIFLLFLAVTALVGSLKKRETADARMPVIFCWISILGVFAAGVLVIQVRAIYYFVWYLLVPLSVSVLCDLLPNKRKILFCTAVLLCGAVNYFYNVYPDISKYREQKQFYTEVVSRLEELGVKTVYGDYQAPTIAACSDARIGFSSVFPNAGAEPGNEGGLLIPYGSPVSTEAYHRVDPESSGLVLSDSPYDELSGYRYLNNYLSAEYRESFEGFFKLEDCFESPQLTYYFYSFTSPALFEDGMIR